MLSSVRNSSASHADVGANNVMDTGLSGTTNWMNDFALSVKIKRHAIRYRIYFIRYMDCGNACDDDIGNQIFSSFTHNKEICAPPSEPRGSQTV